MCKFFRFTLVTLLLFASMSAAALAQSTTDGAIGGVVQDPTGAVVPNASVTVRNEETNKESTATSDGEGRFRVVQLQPGTYTVSITATGFGTSIQQKVVVEVGRVTSLEIPLTVGGTQETVEVTSEAPVINTTQQDFSSNINQTSINELPINGRRASNFVLLTPGVAPDGDFGLISFRGISGLLNNSTVDGGDNNQAFFSEERGRTRISYVVSQAAVREFQVNTSNYSAEYGRAAGGVVNTVTKSGTNEFHGSGFYYIRDDKLGARNPRGTQNVLQNGVVTILPLKPEDRRQQFGATIGGPIVKDRLFFFFSYDQQKRNFPGIANTSQANFFNTVNRAATGAGLTAPSRALTAAQIDSSVAFLVGLTGEVPRKQDQRIFLPKIDFRINDANTFTATYNRFRSESPAGVQTQPTVTRGRASFGDDTVEVDSLITRLTSTLSPTVLNEARFQYSRDNEFQSSNPPSPGEPTTGPGGRSPSVAITNGLTFGKPNFLERRAFPDERRLQFADTVTISSGNHTYKFGGDINRVRDKIDNLFQEGGVYSYNNVNDFIVDFTNFTSGGALRSAGRVCSTSTRLAGQCYTSNFNQGFGPSLFRFTTTDINFFFQDDYRVTPRLTVNLGLRYELQRMPDPQIPNTQTTFTFVDPTNPLNERIPRAVAQTASFPEDRNNFGPRFGFAYDVTGDGKTSVRGGYGIYYGRIINSTLSNAITNTGVSAGQIQLSVAPSATSPIFPNVLPPPTTGAAPSSPAIVVLSPNLANPQIHQADFVFERQVTRNTVVSASYLLSIGRRLPTFVDVNLAFPTASRTFTVTGGEFAGQTVTLPVFTSRLTNNFGAITEVRSIIKSEYNALVLQANRRFTDGLQFQINYTFSRSTDTGQVSQTFTPNAGNTPLNPFDQSFNRGRSNFDIPHRFVASAVYTPDFFGEDQKVGRAIFNGFTISPVITAQSGNTLSANVSGRPAGALNNGITGSNGDSFFTPFGRNTFREPKIVNVDLRVSRRFRFTETMNLEVLAEAFNLFNRTQITSVNETAFAIGGTAAAQTLTPNTAFRTDAATGNTIFRERQVQIAVRFEF